MANKTIGELPAATTPLNGTELVHLVQGGNSRGTPIDEVRGPILKSIASLTIAAGDLLVGLGTGFFSKLAKGSAGQVLRMNAAATAPEWADNGFICRAWANFNGSTSTIRASGNVASVVRNGVGNYTINFATAMSDANFAIVATVNGTGFPSPVVTVTGRTATSVTISTGGSSAGSAAAGDATDINLVVFR